MSAEVLPELVSSSTWLDQVLEDFGRALLRRNYSPATVRTYGERLESLVAGLKAIGVRDIRQLTWGHLEDWQDYMQEEGWKPRTRSLAVTAGRQLIRWASERELLDLRLERALATVKTPDGKPRPLSVDELDKLKAYLLPRRPRMNIVALRDRALVMYLLTTGARVSEVLQVRRDDIERPTVTQKGGTEKTLMLPPVVAEMVYDYLRGRVDDQPWLWVTFKSNSPMRQLGPPGVREVMHKLARKLGIRPFSPHNLRHSCATELLAAGIGELAIAEHLGHHGLGSLPNYGQVREKQRQEAVAVMENLIRPPQFRPMRITPREP